MSYDPISPPGTPARSLVIPSDLVPERAGAVSVLGSQNRRGDWIMPRELRVVAFMGNVEIDLTRARVGPGTSRIEVRCVFGNVEITVPPQLRVECDGTGFLGNFEVNTKGQALLDPSAPIISVGGTAFLGNCEVKVVDPDAPSWIDRLAAKFT